MPDEHPPLLILGASTRAAASSADRAGYRPLCADLFGDTDFPESSTQFPLENYPDDLPRLARDIEEAPWMYTGAMENYPDIITAIARQRPLLGNDAATIARVRDPAFLRDVLTQVALPVPEFRSSADPPAMDGQWMLKPVRSGGGRGIHIWCEAAKNSISSREPHWFQQRIVGAPLSAVFLGGKEDALLVGVCRQFIGEESLHGPTFGYCGSVGPIPTTKPRRSQIESAGRAIAQASGLTGLFGIDFIQNECGVWTIEVNPRYTASVELLEFAEGIRLIQSHALACARGDLQIEPERGTKEGSSPSFELAGSCRVVAKGVLFAKQTIDVPDMTDLLGSGTTEEQGMPLLADRSAIGTRVAAGHPICTVLAGGATVEISTARLTERLQVLQERLWNDPIPIFLGSS